MELCSTDKIELFPSKDKIELYPSEKIELYHSNEKIEETEPLIAFHDNDQIEYVNRNGKVTSIIKKGGWTWKDILNRCCIL